MKKFKDFIKEEQLDEATVQQTTNLMYKIQDQIDKLNDYLLDLEEKEKLPVSSSAVSKYYKAEKVFRKELEAIKTIFRKS